MNAELHYAGFGRRFGAVLVDVLFLLPLAAVVLWLTAHYRLFPLFYIGPGLGLGVIYHVYLVRRFGGTPGKLVAGLRIVKLDGSPIDDSGAILRYLPEAVFSTLTATSMAMAALTMTDADYASLAFGPLLQRLTDTSPVWRKPIEILEHVWIWSEFIVMLTNEKRRALHDFLAGTVVILKPRGDVAPAVTPPPALPGDTRVAASPQAAG
jgi:uncharacterized RDD family membrane protein YckC